MAEPRRRALCLGLAGTAILAGIVWRMAPLGLPRFWWKYGGSFLWAAMVCWLVAAAFPQLRPARLAAAAFSVATAVEVFKLVPGAGLDAFRATLAGKLLLGRFFSAWDLVAYAAAIGMAVLVDALWGAGQR